MKAINTVLEYLSNPKSLLTFGKTMVENHSSKEFYLAFEKDPDGRWYIVCPEYPGPRANLEMVCGADTMLDCVMSEQGYANMVYIKVDLEDNRNASYVFSRTNAGYGADYAFNQTLSNKQATSAMPDGIWLCPVTLFVIGKYPTTINVEPITKQEFQAHH